MFTSGQRHRASLSSVVDRFWCSVLLHLSVTTGTTNDPFAPLRIPIVAFDEVAYTYAGGENEKPNSEHLAP